MKNKTKDPASFRDPGGYVFYDNGNVFRKLHPEYISTFNMIEETGLYNKLVSKSMLIKHKKISSNIIEPEKIPLITYPYEWPFEALKDAAILTLKTNLIALEHNMILKDASSYNIQFLNGKPILIDTLSFEPFKNKPWIAYKQFCENFLAPLSLTSFVSTNLGSLLQSYIDGIPLNLTSKLLPSYTYFNFGILTHIHIHAKAINKVKHFSVNKNSYYKNEKDKIQNLTKHLLKTVEKLNLHENKTEWKNYYENLNSYSKKAFADKKGIVNNWISDIQPNTIWDVGGNSGEISLQYSNSDLTVVIDKDPLAINKIYKQKKHNILPLIIDLTNPSPNLGWNNKERKSLIERGPADVTLGLALIHHLRITHNIPFELITEFFSNITNKKSIIEFVPKKDKKVQYLLRNKEDIYNNYTQSFFEQNIKNFFTIENKVNIKDSERTLYLLKKI